MFKSTKHISKKIGEQKTNRKPFVAVHLYQRIILTRSTLYPVKEVKIYYYTVIIYFIYC